MHNEIVDYLKEHVPGSNGEVGAGEVGDSYVTVDAGKILDVCRTLKHSPWEFNVLQVVTGTDYPEKDVIEVSYILASFTKNHELILKANLSRGTADSLPSIDSVVSVWSAANFQERECYDMLGVNFEGHPDLRRLLTSDDWVGHPLRKDYETPKEYQGMVVDPPEKNNTEDQYFGKRLMEKLDDPKKVSWSWKNKDKEAAAPAAGEQK